MASLAEREVHARRLAERHEWADSWRTRAYEEMLSIAQSELADRFHQYPGRCAAPRAADVVPGKGQPADLRLAKEESHVNFSDSLGLASTLNAQDYRPCPNLPADV